MRFRVFGSTGCSLVPPRPLDLPEEDVSTTATAIAAASCSSPLDARDALIEICAAHASREDVLRLDAPPVEPLGPMDSICGALRHWKHRDISEDDMSMKVTDPSSLFCDADKINSEGDDRKEVCFGSQKSDASLQLRPLVSCFLPAEHHGSGEDSSTSNALARLLTSPPDLSRDRASFIASGRAAIEATVARVKSCVARFEADDRPAPRLPTLEACMSEQETTDSETDVQHDQCSADCNPSDLGPKLLLPVTLVDAATTVCQTCLVPPSDLLGDVASNHARLQELLSAAPLVIPSRREGEPQPEAPPPPRGSPRCLVPSTSSEDGERLETHPHLTENLQPLWTRGIVAESTPMAKTSRGTSLFTQPPDCRTRGTLPGPLRGNGFSWRSALGLAQPASTAQGAAKSIFLQDTAARRIAPGDSALRPLPQLPLSFVAARLAPPQLDSRFSSPLLYVPHNSNLVASQHQNVLRSLGENTATGIIFDGLQRLKPSRREMSGRVDDRPQRRTELLFRTTTDDDEVAEAALLRTDGQLDIPETIRNRLHEAVAHLTDPLSQKAEFDGDEEGVRRSLDILTTEMTSVADWVLLRQHKASKPSIHPRHLLISSPRGLTKLLQLAESLSSQLRHAQKIVNITNEPPTRGQEEQEKSCGSTFLVAPSPINESTSQGVVVCEGLAALPFRDIMMNPACALTLVVIPINSDDIFSAIDDFNLLWAGEAESMNAPQREGGSLCLSAHRHHIVWVCSGPLPPPQVIVNHTAAMLYETDVSIFGSEPPADSHASLRLDAVPGFELRWRPGDAELTGLAHCNEALMLLQAELKRLRPQLAAAALPEHYVRDHLSTRASVYSVVSSALRAGRIEEAADVLRHSEVALRGTVTSQAAIHGSLIVRSVAFVRLLGQVLHDDGHGAAVAAAVEHHTQDPQCCSFGPVRRLNAALREMTAGTDPNNTSAGPKASAVIDAVRRHHQPSSDSASQSTKPSFPDEILLVVSDDEYSSRFPNVSACRASIETAVKPLGVNSVAAVAVSHCEEGITSFTNDGSHRWIILWDIGWTVASTASGGCVSLNLPASLAHRLSTVPGACAAIVLRKDVSDEVVSGSKEVTESLIPLVDERQESSAAAHPCILPAAVSSVWSEQLDVEYRGLRRHFIAAHQAIASVAQDRETCYEVKQNLSTPIDDCPNRRGHAASTTSEPRADQHSTKQPSLPIIIATTEAARCPAVLQEVMKRSAEATIVECPTLVDRDASLPEAMMAPPTPHYVLAERNVGVFLWDAGIIRRNEDPSDTMGVFLNQLLLHYNQLLIIIVTAGLAPQPFDTLLEAAAFLSAQAPHQRVAYVVVSTPTEVPRTMINAVGSCAIQKEGFCGRHITTDAFAPQLEPSPLTRFAASHPLCSERDAFSSALQCLDHSASFASWIIEAHRNSLRHPAVHQNDLDDQQV